MTSSIPNEHGMAISFRGICKSYGAVRANVDVSFDVRKGAVHAVIGENGAGKSTLMRMLSGAEHPDDGRIFLNGRPVRLANPREAARHGIGMVYQDLTVAPSLSVWENIVLGAEPSVHGFIAAARARSDVEAMIERYGMRLPAAASTGDLPLAQQQQVEILRALYRGSDILILDEPTAILTPTEAAQLFGAIRRLSKQGATVLFVGHKLPEITAIADQITVMRNGRALETLENSEVDVAKLARLIVGRDLEAIAHQARSPGEIRLEVEKIRAEGAKSGVMDISFACRAGQIVGIAGVAGNGQSELAGALSGMIPISAGRVSLKGATANLVLDANSTGGADSVRRLREAGLSVIPQDRRGTGSAASEPLWYSMFAGRFWRWRTSRLAMLDSRRAKRATREIVWRLGVKADTIDARPSQLSGGNLQKFIIGREFSDNPSVLLAEDPTRGVDIGASRLIRQEIRRMADAGAAVVLISTDLDELLEIADDLIVLSGGRVNGRFPRSDVTPEALGRAVAGQTARSHDLAQTGEKPVP